MKTSDIVSQIRGLVEEILTKCDTKVSKSFKSFIIENLILYQIMQKVNYTQLARYGSKCEKTYRNNSSNGGRKFDAVGFNTCLAKEYFEGCQGCTAIAIDPSYISHTGKHTPGIGYFWSGCAQSAKLGLEILGIGVINTEAKDCIMLSGVQTPAPEDSARKAIDWEGKIPQYLVGTENITDLAHVIETVPNAHVKRPYHKKDDEEAFNKLIEDAKAKGQKFSLTLWYLLVIQCMAERLKRLSNTVVADAFFSKKPFADGLEDVGMHLVSRFRDDAVLMYLYRGRQTGKRGRPKLFDGKVNLDELDPKVFFEVGKNFDDGKYYCGIVYSKALKRKVKVVIWKSKDGKRKKIYFSTNYKQHSGNDIVKIYRTRFQIEFCFRDSKENASLCKCQARSISKLQFNYNMSFTSVNCLKYVAKQNGIDFSMSNLKTIMHGHYLLDRFICVSGIKPNSDLIKKLETEIVSLTAYDLDIAS